MRSKATIIGGAFLISIGLLFGSAMPAQAVTHHFFNGSVAPYNIKQTGTGMITGGAVGSNLYELGLNYGLSYSYTKVPGVSEPYSGTQGHYRGGAHSHRALQQGFSQCYWHRIAGTRTSAVLDCDRYY